MVEAFGWPEFFICTFAIALPGLALLWWQRRVVRALEEVPTATAAPAPAE
jgi:PAT family beta-lactamase induction signal transducer AmpG